MYEHKNIFVFVLEHEEDDDLKTMEKLFGKSPTNISKITYFQNMYEHKYLCLFQNEKDDDG